MDDGLQSALNCLQALEGQDCIETRKSLWLAAKRYAAKGRGDREWRDPPVASHARHAGEQAQRDCGDLW